MSDPFDPDNFDPERHEPDALEQFDLDPDRLTEDFTTEETDGDSIGLSSENAPPGLKTLFWKLVLFYKVSIIAVTLGALLVIFDVRAESGIMVLLGGLLIFAYTLFLSWRGKRRVENGAFETEELEGDSEAAEPGDSE